MESLPTRAKRESERYRLALDVRTDRGAGVTRDMSASGVYFVTDQPFAPGTSIGFTITFEHADPEQALQMRCSGTIVRVEEEGGRVGVAARIDSCAFTTS